MIIGAGIPGDRTLHHARGPLQAAEIAADKDGSRIGLHERKFLPHLEQPPIAAQSEKSKEGNDDQITPPARFMGRGFAFRFAIAFRHAISMLEIPWFAPMS